MMKKRRVTRSLETVAHVAVRSNFRHIASFLTPYETRQIVALSSSPFDARLAQNVYVLAQGGHIAALKFSLEVRKFPKPCRRVFRRICAAAAENDESSVLEFLFRRFDFFPSTEDAILLAMRGATGCVFYMNDVAPFVDDRILSAACNSGSVWHVERIMQATRLPLTKRCVTLAIVSRSLPLLRWLYNHNCPVDSVSASCAAAEYSSMETLRFLMSRKLVFASQTVTLALLGNRREVTKILLDYGVLPPPSALRAALMKNDVESFELFLLYGAVPSTQLLAECLVFGRTGIIRRLCELGLRLPESLVRALRES